MNTDADAEFTGQFVFLILLSLLIFSRYVSTRMFTTILFICFYAIVFNYRLVLEL